MISCSSSLASSTPATSLNVTRFCWFESSLARLFPKERALLPPDCICRMMKIQKTMKRMIGAHQVRIIRNVLFEDVLKPSIFVPAFCISSERAFWTSWFSTSAT